MNYRIIKYGMVGISGLIIDFSLTYLLKEKLKWNKYIANTIGFSCAVISNFILNRNWTFQVQNGNISNQFALFFFASLLGLVINNSVIYMLHRKYSFYLSKAIAVVIVFAWNYLFNSYYTFH